MTRSCSRLRVAVLVSLAAAGAALCLVPHAGLAAPPGASLTAAPPAPDTGAAKSVYPWIDLIRAEGDPRAAGSLSLVERGVAAAPMPLFATDAPPLLFEPPRLDTRQAPTCVQAADLDGDGHLDLAVAEHMGPSVIIFYGDGTGAFPDSRRLEFASRPTWLEPVDLNGDGRLDLLTLSWNWPTWEGLIRVAFNDGGRDWSMGEWDHAGDFPVQIIVADWSGDGLPDAATANYLGWTVTMLRNVGGGRFDRVAELPTSPDAAMLAFSDLDGDGHAELLVTGSGCNFADVYRHVGGDTWLPEPGIGVQWQAYAVGAVDLDGANGPDAVIGSGNGAASVLMNDGAGRFAGWTDYATHAAPVHVLTPDLDADGVPDVVTSHYASSAVTPLLNRGAAGFIPLAGPAPGGAPVGYHAGPGATASAAGDFNEDGRIDLATADANGTTVSLLFGRPDGTLAANRSIGVGSRPYAIAVADLDRDGLEDLVMPLRYVDRLGVFMGRADGSFAAQVQYATGDDPIAVAAGDLNADGAPDVVTANEYSGDISVFLNRGDGTLLPRTDYPAGFIPLSIAIGDITGNAAPELAVASYGEDVVYLFTNLGDGRFLLSEQVLRTQAGPTDVIFLDFNGDGALDVAAANYDAGSVSTWYNAGLGQFVSPSVVGRRWGCWALAAGQIVPGGAPEIVCANRDASTVTLLEVNQWGMTTRYRNITVGQGPAAAVVADLDADGDHDVAVPVMYGSGLTVLSNQAGTLTTAQQLPLGRYPVDAAAMNPDLAGGAKLAVAMVGDYSAVVLGAPGTLSGAPVAAPIGARATMALGTPAPNPSRGSVSVAFAAPAAASGRLSVVDVSGREVAVLRSGAFAVGPGLASWDGRDARGRAVRSGVYFVLFQLGDRRATARFTVMR